MKKKGLCSEHAAVEIRRGQVATHCTTMSELAIAAAATLAAEAESANAEY